MEKCYVYRNELDKEELLEIYKEKLAANPKFEKEMHEDQITITNGFLVYPKIEGDI
ncbi:hypothetical protein HDR67_01170, partial [bacterium]|nr:hypothetical protein [bacterium]